MNLSNSFSKDPDLFPIVSSRASQNQFQEFILSSTTKHKIGVFYVFVSSALLDCFQGGVMFEPMRAGNAFYKKQRFSLLHSSIEIA